MSDGLLYALIPLAGFAIGTAWGYFHPRVVYRYQLYVDDVLVSDTELSKEEFEAL